MDLYIINVESLSNTFVFGIYRCNKIATTEAMEYSKIIYMKKQEILAKINKTILCIDNNLDRIVLNCVPIDNVSLYVVNIETKTKTFIFGVFVDEKSARNAIQNDSKIKECKEKNLVDINRTILYTDILETIVLNTIRIGENDSPQKEMIQEQTQDSNIQNEISKESEQIIQTQDSNIQNEISKEPEQIIQTQDSNIQIEISEQAITKNIDVVKNIETVQPDFHLMLYQQNKLIYQQNKMIYKFMNKTWVG